MKKSNIIFTIICTVLGVFSAFSYFLVRLSTVDEYRIGTYSQTTIENFINDGGSFYYQFSDISSPTILSFSGTDKEGKLTKELFKDIKFEDKGNEFPYQYKQNTSYVYLRISTEYYVLRISDNLTDVALEYRNMDGHSYYRATAVRYYTISQEDTQVLIGFTYALSLEEGE